MKQNGEMGTVKKLFAAVGAALALLASGEAKAAIISVNLVATDGAMGTNLAGVVHVGNWNDFPGNLVLGTPLALVDDSGAGTGASLNLAADVSQSSVVPSMGNTGDDTLLTGHLYNSAFAPVDLVFASIPYAVYDVRIYYNWANNPSVNGIEEFRVVESGQFTRGFNSDGADTSFVLSDGVGGNEANYAEILNVNLANMTLRALGVTSPGGFAVINGVQILEVPPVPEPATALLLTLGGGLVFIHRRKSGQRARS